MRFEDVAIPAGAAWSSPFAKWQGTLADLPSLALAADVTGRALQQRHIDVTEMAALVLGWTVPEPDSFFGAPSLAGRLGIGSVTGPMISQACATSVACLSVAAGAVQAGAGPQLVVATDRTSNGPTMMWPQPAAPAGAPRIMNWMLDNFGRDPWAGTSMLAAGEAVARESGVGRAELDELAAMRSDQYQKALADDRGFQRRYMVDVHVPQRRKPPLVVDADEGVRPVVLEQIRDLPPASPDGLHSFATQTHPADGTAGAVVTTIDRARALARGAGVVRLLATATARVASTHMPEAPVPAALAAIADAGLKIEQIDAVTTHNPFAVNDIYFSRQTGYPLENMNAHGCSLIFGHPQAPTGLRSIAELIEELRLRGGGVGLFTGCAAGDSAAAVVLRVED
jgi:acetyl-CoA C-acetyltransferase